MIQSAVFILILQILCLSSLGGVWAENGADRVTIQKGEEYVKLTAPLFFQHGLNQVTLDDSLLMHRSSPGQALNSKRYSHIYHLSYRGQSRPWSLRVPPRYSRVRVKVWENNLLVLDSVVRHRAPFTEAVEDPLKTLTLFFNRGANYRIGLEYPPRSHRHKILILMPELVKEREASLLWFVSHTFVGFVLATLFVNLVLMLVFKLKVFFWYFAYLVAFSLMSIFFLQTDRLYFNGMVEEGMVWVDLFMLLTLVFFAKFTFHYFHWREKYPSLRKLQALLFYGALFLIVLRTYEWTSVLLIFNEYLLVSGLLVLFVFSLKEWKEGNREAPLFCAALGCYFFGIFVVVLNEFSTFIPTGLNSATFPALLGAVLQMMVVTYLISLRVIREIQQSHQRAEVELNFRENLVRNMSHELRTPMVGMLGVMDQLAEVTALSEATRSTVTTKVQRLKKNLNFILGQMSEHKSERRQYFESSEFEDLCFRQLRELYTKVDLERSGAREIPICLRREETIDVLLTLIDGICGEVEHPKLSWLWDWGEKSWTLTIRGRAEENPFKRDPLFFEAGIAWLHQHWATSTVSFAEGGWALTFSQEVDWSAEEKEKIALQKASLVVVVDDNFLNRKVLKRMLERLELQVESFSSGEQFLKFLKENHEKISLVLMDIQMPEQDGFEVTRNLRSLEKEHHLPQLPVWAITALDTSRVYGDCMEVGMQGVFSKPFESHRLKTLLENSR